MSVILNSTETKRAARRVSVLIPLNACELKSGDEWTNTSLSSSEAFGNFLRNESLYEPTSNFVDRFLFRDLRIMNPTLSLSRNEAEIRIIETVRISIANSFPIFRNSFIYIKEISVH